MTGAVTQRRWSAAHAGVALLTCLLVLFACQRYGPAVDNDTADFFSAADSVVAGQGLIMTTGRLFILWPPLHPLVLAGFSQLGVEHVDASLIFNLLALCVTLWLGARLVTRLSGAPALGLLWCVVVALAPDFFWIHTRALSEAPFLAFCTAAIYGCSAFLEEGRRRHFALMVIGAGLAWVERYAGMVILPVFCVCLLVAPGSVRLVTRVKRSALFGILAGLPMLPWVIRNLVHTHQFTGDRGSFGEFGIPALEALGQSVRTITAWFTLRGNVPMTILAVAAILAAAAGLLTATRTEQRPAKARFLPLIGFPLIYLAFTDVININYEIDGLGPRQMLPALPAGWALALLAGHRAYASLKARAGAWSRAASWVLLLAIGTNIALAGHHTLNHARHLNHSGAGFYSTPRWQDSPVVAAVADFPFEGEVRSNDVYALYLFTGQRSTPLPRKPFGYKALARRLAEEQRSIQVFWVQTNERNRLPIERMQSSVAITTLLTAEDGFVYQLDPR